MHAVTLLGEGNFSFANAAANMIKKRDPLIFSFLELDAAAHTTVFLSCTSFDGPRQALLDKYPETIPLFQKLESHENVEIVHNVNAWDPRTFSQSHAKWSRILWNHPHLGIENFKQHRFLMSHLFYTTSQLLTDDDGLIMVTLVRGQAKRWDLKGCAERHGVVLVKVKPFVQSDYSGYEAKRNCHAKSFKAQCVKDHHQSAMQSFTFVFAKGHDKQAAAVFGVDYTEPAGLSDEGHIEKENNPEVCLEKIKTFTCEECKKSFSTSQGLCTHRRQVHELNKYTKFVTETEEGILECDQCDKKFNDEEARWNHKISKHGEVRHGGFDNLFPNEEAKKAHHDGREGFTACEVCGQAVPDGWGMEQHEEALKPIVGLQAKCLLEGCGKTFLETRALIQHIAYCAHRGNHPSSKCRVR